jgi:hypothetical protein
MKLPKGCRAQLSWREFDSGLFAAGQLRVQLWYFIMPNDSGANHWDSSGPLRRGVDDRKLVRHRNAARNTVLFGIPHRAWADRGGCMGGEPVRRSEVEGRPLTRAPRGSLSSILPASTGIGA